MHDFVIDLVRIATAQMVAGNGMLQTSERFHADMPVRSLPIVSLRIDE